MVALDVGGLDDAEAVDELGEETAFYGVRNFSGGWIRDSAGVAAGHPG